MIRVSNVEMVETVLYQGWIAATKLIPKSYLLFPILLIIFLSGF
jgi:hypothetical protein